MKKLLQTSLLFGLLALAACQPGADTTPPIVNLSLSNSTPTVGTELALKAVATDNIGIKQVEFFAGETSLSIDTTSPYETTVQVTANVTSYKAVATDTAGNTSQDIRTIIIAKDTTPPTVSLSITSGVLVAGIPATLTAVATDNIGIKQVEFFVGKGDSSSIFISLGVDTAQPFEQALTADQVIVGTKTFKAVATDTDSNTTEASQLVTIVPAPAPIPKVSFTVRLKDIEILARSDDELDEGLQLNGVVSAQLQDAGSTALANHTFIAIDPFETPLSLKPPFVAIDGILEDANSASNKIQVIINLFEVDRITRKSFGRIQLDVVITDLSNTSANASFLLERVLETEEGDKIKVIFEIFETP